MNKQGVIATWGRLGLQLKLTLLIQGLLLVVLLAAQMGFSQWLQEQTLREATDKAKVVADGVNNALNTLMVTKVDDTDVISDAKARETFITKMNVSDRLKELRVMRSKGVIDEFGEGLPSEQPKDDLDRAAIATGKAQITLTRDSNGQASLRAVIPSIGYKEFRGSNCLKCHGVEEGTVLGAVSVTTDVQPEMDSIERMNLVVWIGQIALQVILFFAISAIVRRQLAQLGAQPRDVADLAQRIAAGDLSADISLKTGDSKSVMAQMRFMQDSLTSMVRDVRKGARGVANASGEIANGNRDLSGRTEQQVDALEKTASSMEQLGTTVSNNAQSAQKASELVQKAAVIAERGGKEVSLVVSTMEGINESSQRINSIIGVIDSIAFQTNILALNAAVEAARAGEQGRGFAVVASEVRSLAQRSSEAAREIKQLIETSVERVEQGATQVNKAGATMSDVVKAVENVKQLITDIAEASTQQAQGVAQVGDAITQMDRTTQQNANMVQHMATATDNLQSLADELVRSVEVFRLRGR